LGVVYGKRQEVTITPKVILFALLIWGEPEMIGNIKG
jgi:hypothetical protein